MKLELCGIETSLERSSHESKSYYIQVKFEDEETEDGKYRALSHNFASLLSDYEPEDMDDDFTIARSMQKRHREGGDSIVPRTRKELTNDLVRLAAKELMDGYDGVVRIQGVEVQERRIAMETPYEDMDWGDDDE